MIVAVLVILSVVGLIYWAYTEDSIAVPEVEQLNLFTEDISCNTAGDCISFLIPDVQESESTQPVKNTIVENMEQEIQQSVITNSTMVNGTSVSTVDPELSSITGDVKDISVTRTGEIVQDFSYLGDHMRVQIGNIATISGQIKIIDPITKETIQPQLYKYMLSIECSDVSEFCNLSPLVSRGATESDGSFVYKWTTSTSQHTVGLYDIEIMAVSETRDADGKKLSVSHTMFLELFS